MKKNTLNDKSLAMGPKCLVVMKGQKRAMIIILGPETGNTCRLPFVSEIDKKITHEFPPLAIDEKLSLLLNLREETSSWDLLNPFPPHDYYDSWYVELNNRDEDVHWLLLNEYDKELILKNIDTILHAL